MFSKKLEGASRDVEKKRLIFWKVKFFKLKVLNNSEL
jgi:hypothetical protein